MNDFLFLKVICLDNIKIRGFSGSFGTFVHLPWYDFRRVVDEILYKKYQYYHLIDERLYASNAKTETCLSENR